MITHTPGPWSWGVRLTGSENHAGFHIWANKGWKVALVNPLDSTGEAGKANARLIAEAPALLEFAQEVRRTGDTRLASMAIAVIAKATRGAA